MTEQDAKKLSIKDEPIHFCNFCNKPAEFRCGNCQETSYCTYEHQKVDWPNHKRRCIKPEDKLKEMKKEANTLKKFFLDYLSRGLIADC